MEGIHDEFSLTSFLQSDGGITGLLSIKTALEELEESSKGKSQASSIVQLIQINRTHTISYSV